MFKNFRLWAKIMIGMGFALILVVGGLVTTGLNEMERVITAAEKQSLHQYAESVISDIRSETRLAAALSSLLASMPIVQEKFSLQDRAWLAEQLVPSFKVMSGEYNAKQFQFHTPPATSFLRLHKPEKFGDDLSTFRFSVVNTNDQQETTTGLEKGVAGLGARGVVPVFFNQQHLGSVEFGMSFGQPFFDSFKKATGVDAALHFIEEDRYSTFAYTLKGGDSGSGQDKLYAHLTPRELSQAFNGTPQYRRKVINGTPSAIYARVVNNYSGDPLGVIELVMDSSHNQQAMERERNQSLLIALVALLVGIAIALLIARAIGSRLNLLIAGVSRVSEGNLSTPIPVSGRDEITELARATEDMRRDLNQMVAQVMVNASSANDAAHEIESAVRSQAAISSETSASVAEITSTMEELSASSTQIAEYSEKVVAIAKDTLEESREGSDAMQQIHHKMEEIKDENRQSLEEIIRLGSKSKEISKVMEIINNIADQTKLIAFNAALEASSAGEAGQRFSVVASEIRRLADSVTESTGEIEKKINEIQDSISRLVITSEKGASGIDEGVNISSQTATRLDDLVDAASKSTRSAEQISLSTQQQKSASDQVLIALREIVSANGNTEETINKIQEIAHQLTAISGELDRHMGRFILSPQESSSPKASSEQA
ncbi:MAG: methyl-accepting chemotaxis protein [Gammaproteobacteria bacterium]|nr:methyl-accepting chemotaxis protein [Gammaproteobacteria bacterium]